MLLATPSAYWEGVAVVAGLVATPSILLTVIFVPKVRVKRWKDYGGRKRKRKRKRKKRVRDRKQKNLGNEVSEIVFLALRFIWSGKIAQGAKNG